MRNGIAVAGLMMVDEVKYIKKYPELSSITAITQIVRTLGGGMCNCAIALSRLDPLLPIQAIGVAGEDELGELTLFELAKMPTIDTDRIRRQGRHGFTDVMTELSSMKRTMFSHFGANALLCCEDFDFDTMDVKLLYVGYLFALDGLDAHDDEYGTVLARVLHDAQERCIQTAVDMISESDGRTAEILPYALKYTDYCVINELEAQTATGYELGITVRRKNAKKACERLLEMGVNRWAIIHAPEVVFGMSKDGDYFELPTLLLPEGYIKGTVGAGDAFCSGVLYSAHQELGLEQALKNGMAAAASALSMGCCMGVVPIAEEMALYESMPKRELQTTI